MKGCEGGREKRERVCGKGRGGGEEKVSKFDEAQRRDIDKRDRQTDRQRERQRERQRTQVTGGRDKTRQCKVKQDKTRLD